MGIGKKKGKGDGENAEGGKKKGGVFSRFKKKKQQDDKENEDVTAIDSTLVGDELGKLGLADELGTGGGKGGEVDSKFVDLSGLDLDGSDFNFLDEEGGDKADKSEEEAAAKKKTPYLDLVAMAVAEHDGEKEEEEDQLAKFGRKARGPPSVGSNYEIRGLSVPATSVVFADNIVYIGDVSGNIHLYSVESRSHIRTLEGHEAAVRCIQVDIDNERGSTWIYTAASDGEVRRWRKNGKCVQALSLHQAPIHCLQVSSKQQLVFTASADKTAKVADYKSGETLMTFTGHDAEVWCVVFAMLKTRTGKMPALFTGAADGSIKQWEVESGECIKTFEGHRDAVRCLTVEDTQGLLFSGDVEGIIIKWRIRSGYELTRLTQHTAAVRCLRLVGEKLYSSSSDETVRPLQIFSL
mmetsp:Transcript_28985/g.74408  ORF Transcript_28985/g.74408 Transcript_28985/m.74408 type:complete len:409 (-) Transcript_28985:1104-2330(-)